MSKMTAEDILRDIESRGRMAIGKFPYVRFLKGEKVSPVARIRANCYACMGYYTDGKRDCCNELCPFYAFMPYGKSRKRLPGEASVVEGDLEQLEDAEDAEAVESGAESMEIMREPGGEGQPGK